MRRWAERGVFLVLAAAMVIAAALLPSPPRREEAEAPEVFVYRGYAAAADAPFSETSLDFAVRRFSHLIEKYFAGTEDGYRLYLSVVPDKAEFMETPEGYVPAGAAETLDYLAQRLPVTAVDISALLGLEDYYRTDPHWKQECLHPAAEAILTAMGAPAPDTAEETLMTLEGAFHGSYWGKTEEALAPDTLAYLTWPGLESCTVYDYETGSTGGVYDFAAAKDAPYDLFLGGSKSLLRIENPQCSEDRTLVVFRDSFGSSLVPLLAESYRTVYAVDIRYIATDALSRAAEFPAGADVLLLYSAAVLQNSITLK